MSFSSALDVLESDCSVTDAFLRVCLSVEWSRFGVSMSAACVSEVALFDH